MNNYAKDRDDAFKAFVHDDDFSHIEELFKKYDMSPHIPSMEVAKAGIYKAVQECTDIDEETKTIARQKCIELGFSPYMF